LNKILPPSYETDEEISGIQCKSIIRARIIRSTDNPCADHPVCRLSVQYRKLLMTKDEGGK